MIGVLSAGAATGGESLASMLPMIVIWAGFTVLSLISWRK